MYISMYIECLLKKICNPASELFGAICHQLLRYANFICKIMKCINLVVSFLQEYYLCKSPLIKNGVHVFPCTYFALDIKVSENQVPQSLGQCSFNLLTHTLLVSGCMAMRTLCLV